MVADPSTTAILLTADEVAAVLRVSRSTVYREIRDGTIRGLKLGKGRPPRAARRTKAAVRVPLLELAAYLERCGDRDAMARLRKFLGPQWQGR